MPTLRYVTLDVFTTTRFEGNPLAVVLVPPSQSSLTTEQKQMIAREFNFSETIFLHENGPGTEVEDREELVRIDIFTPYVQLPFAGHPTIGAGYYLHNLHPQRKTTTKFVLQALAGKIPIAAPATGVACLSIPHDVHLHTKGIPVQGQLSQLFPNIPADGFFSATVPVFSIVKGMAFALVRLTSLYALGAVTVSPKGISNDILDAPWDTGFIGVYFYYVVEEPGEGENAFWKVRTRMIAESVEDPATGSAASALSSYLALQSEKNARTHSLEIVQGVEMKRRSEIFTEVALSEDGIRVESLRLSGGAVKVMEGSLQY